MTMAHKIHGTYATTETFTLNEGEVETIEQGNERTFECECGEEFADVEEAKEHLLEEDEPETIEIIRKNLPEGTSIISYEYYSNWMIDLDGAKLPFETVGPLVEQGYVVTGSLSNPRFDENVELRFWLRELDQVSAD